MSRLRQVRQRRIALREEISAARMEVREGAQAIRTETAGMLLALSISRLFGGGSRVRSLLSLLAAGLTIAAARAVVQYRKQ